MCEKHNVQVIERVSYTLYDPEDIHSLNKNTVPNTFEDFKRICSKIGDPEKPLPKLDLNFIASRLIKTDDIYIKEKHQVPDLAYFKKEKECDEQDKCLFQGGETKALELCKNRLDYETVAFKAGISNPNLKKPVIFTTEVSLSPYFRFGCLSIRKFYWDIKNCYEKVTNCKAFKLCKNFLQLNLIYFRILLVLKEIFTRLNNCCGVNTFIKCLIKTTNSI